MTVFFDKKARRIYNQTEIFHVGRCALELKKILRDDNINVDNNLRSGESELMRLDEAPRGEVAQPMQQTLTSENSGLSPGYSVTPIQNTRPVAPDDVLPNVTATAAIVIEASTGHVLYERNPDKIMFPASTTKMMTLITALEGNKLDEIVTVGPGAYIQRGRFDALA